MAKPCAQRNTVAAPRDGTRAEADAAAVKQAIARQIEREMRAQDMTKTVMAARMRTSRAALNRLLDTSDTGLTLATLTSAALVLGVKLSVRLVRH
ncbi:MAG TPA: Fis family transcriptional regulator [Burkholderiales bacterium]|nr:Fis family transcriptional regulator [Burkholderiales bacterium]